MQMPADEFMPRSLQAGEDTDRQVSTQRDFLPVCAQQSAARKRDDAFTYLPTRSYTRTAENYFGDVESEGAGC